MKYKNIIAFFLLICMVFLTSCSAENPSQVVLNENFPEEMSEGEAAADSAESVTDVCYVYICGAVYEPGVYGLPTGSRLYEVVEAAGGFLPEASEESCNLASVINDGMQYRIPTKEEVLSGNSAAELQLESTSHYDSEGRLDLNLATAAELMMLSGIGQTRADAIITYRGEHGSFSNKEEIMQVTGIKEGLYSKIEDFITVR